MDQVSAIDIRASFRNCSKGEASRVTLPDLDAVPWPDLDFLGWPDPDGSRRAYLVTPYAPGGGESGQPGQSGESGESGAVGEPGLLGLVLSQTQPGTRGAARATMCQLCLTPHNSQGVCLTVARKAGAAGRKGDSSGLYSCRDLACSLYIRGKRVSGSPRLRETLDVDQLVARTRANLADFVARVLAPSLSG